MRFFRVKANVVLLSALFGLALPAAAGRVKARCQRHLSVRAGPSSETRDLRSQTAAGFAVATAPGENDYQIRDHDRRLHQTEIYENILASALDVLPAPIAFPFAAARLTWLKRFGAKRSRPAKVVAGYAGLLVHATRYVRAARGNEPSVDELAEVTGAEMKARWITRLGRVEHELRRGLVTIPVERAQDLGVLIRDYNRLYPRDPLGLTIHFKTELIGLKASAIVGQVNLAGRDDALFGGAAYHPLALYQSLLANELTRLSLVNPKAWPVPIDEWSFDEGVDAFETSEEAKCIENTKLGLALTTQALGAAFVIKHLRKGAVGSAASGLVKYCVKRVCPKLLPGVSWLMLIGGVAWSNYQYVQDEQVLQQSLTTFFNRWFGEAQAAAFRASVLDQVILPAKALLDVHAEQRRRAAGPSIELYQIERGTR